eukprot:TRINITY_DN10181_c0_g1_i1.p1 TRINITY_DN10181_c0_g1~~TRINITY_DN10181_c0_g1_i1.p1  ORF type:complete len:236 (-),score=52.25 TRINITY_DN10181_c0_g1_i1:81-731(-)
MCIRDRSTQSTWGSRQEIMKKYEEKRAAFLKKNEQILIETRKKETEEEIVCNFCLERLNEASENYGLICYMTRSNVRQHALFQQLMSWCIEKQNDVLTSYMNQLADISSTVWGISRGQFVLSSCGHYIHHECYIAQLKNLKNKSSSEFLCGSCKSISNLLLPRVQALKVNQYPLDSSKISLGDLTGVAGIILGQICGTPTHSSTDIEKSKKTRSLH